MGNENNSDAGIEKLWQETLERIKFDVAKPGFETWLKTTKPVTRFKNRIILEVPNEFAKEWLETRYLDFLKEKLTEVSGENLEITLATPQDTQNLSGEKQKTEKEMKSEEKNEVPPLDNPAQSQKSQESESMFSGDLNPKYTFDTFVIGSSNRFAHAASLAVAEAPAKAYNPLFIYGGVGLGKTHLLHAVGQYILERNQEVNVVYVSSEKFTNELINSIRDDQTVAFRNKYRNIDVLLIDDIQFLAGKERTQEEFFHTFNSLYDARKQLVISSDRPPKEIPTLEERLRSRFEWGLITDIQEPDLETRIAILRKKAEMENLEIPNEVIVYIANNIKSNIRELEGALIRVMAYASLNNNQLTTEMTQRALKDIIPDNEPKMVTIDVIKKQVAGYFNLQLSDMVSKKRTRAIAFPRQIAMYLSREMTDHSLPEIGEQFGGRDHTTVLHAHKKITKELTEDPQLDNTVKEITSNIRSTPG